MTTQPDADLDWLQAHDPGKKPTPAEREAWHQAAQRQAMRYAHDHPESVEDYSDADPGL